MRRNATRMLALAGLFALVSCGGSKGKGGTTPGGDATPTAFFDGYKRASPSAAPEAARCFVRRSSQTQPTIANSATTIAAPSSGAAKAASWSRV